MQTRQVNQIIISEEAQTRLRLKQCPSCGKPKEEWTRRRDWTCCSSECTNKYTGEMVIFGWQHLRLKAQVRDGHKCVKCGSKGEEVVVTNQLGNKETKSLQGDHIIPIALGGEEFNLDNIQTLCFLCHKIKTREDMKAIVNRRKLEKHLSRGQLQLT